MQAYWNLLANRLLKDFNQDKVGGAGHLHETQTV